MFASHLRIIVCTRFAPELMKKRSSCLVRASTEVSPKAGQAAGLWACIRHRKVSGSTDKTPCVSNTNGQ